MSEIRAKISKKALRINVSKAAGQKRPVMPASVLAFSSNKFGSTTAKPEIKYSASNCVIAMEKQNPTSAAECRNLLVRTGISGADSNSVAAAVGLFSASVCE